MKHIFRSEFVSSLVCRCWNDTQSLCVYAFLIQYLFACVFCWERASERANENSKRGSYKWCHWVFEPLMCILFEFESEWVSVCVFVCRFVCNWHFSFILRAFNLLFSLASPCSFYILDVVPTWKIHHAIYEHCVCSVVLWLFFVFHLILFYFSFHLTIVIFFLVLPLLQHNNTKHASLSMITNI